MKANPVLLCPPHVARWEGLHLGQRRSHRHDAVENARNAPRRALFDSACVIDPHDAPQGGQVRFRCTIRTCTL
eukprot:897221-Prymnesium_polylepis.1